MSFDDLQSGRVKTARAHHFLQQVAKTTFCCIFYYKKMEKSWKYLLQHSAWIGYINNQA